MDEIPVIRRGSLFATLDAWGDPQLWRVSDNGTPVKAEPRDHGDRPAPPPSASMTTRV